MYYGPSFASHLRLPMTFWVPAALASTSSDIIRDGFMGARRFLRDPSALSPYPGHIIDLRFYPLQILGMRLALLFRMATCKRKGEVIGTASLLDVAESLGRAYLGFGQDSRLLLTKQQKSKSSKRTTAGE